MTVMRVGLYGNLSETLSNNYFERTESVKQQQHNTLTSQEHFCWDYMPTYFTQLSCLGNNIPTVKAANLISFQYHVGIWNYGESLAV